ncbi:hypothetical protein CC1G_14417 [Coprinopsis cinerea okayama7|uniref:DUF4112 domain-containing protein n=1 Tax=Coprinopsis cinerea (strain Okayama-7 / 130 / ATCC MYA-4618 / FGSC 9003) TaxID=240176 RepID=D6RM28_COPC7|nr:hypothetical protein CC1G_14417 [Coprinopsis cinerea okayama7\|eukprot:XP_002911420.1 hypothetical protein CC1G_14417 [Coprinopsis cinerea okayama7\
MNEGVRNAERQASSFDTRQAPTDTTQRELPPGLSARDAAILRSVKRRAHYLDKGFNLCGLRFGWTFIINLVPVVGDAIAALLNYSLVVRKARKADLPPWLLSRMMANNAVSFAVGFIPFVGDVLLAVFKANSRNAALLEEFLRIRGEEYLKLHPELLMEQANGKQKKGSGWFGWARKAPLSESDRQQIKPGSGMKPGEVVQEVSVVPPAEEQATASHKNGSKGRFLSVIRKEKPPPASSTTASTSAV